MLAIEASWPQFMIHTTRKSCTTSAHSNSNYKAVCQRKSFPTFLKKFVHYRLKSTFLKSCISLSLCRSNCFFFIHIPCFLNGLSSKGANKCIVDSCDMLNISVWVVKARAQVDLSLKQ